jgi:hypothetical protein
MFGFVSVNEIFKLIRKLPYLKNEDLYILEIIIPISGLMINFGVSFHPKIGILFHLFLLLLIYSFRKIMDFYFHEKFLKCRLGLVNNLILNIKSGRSLREFLRVSQITDDYLLKFFFERTQLIIRENLAVQSQFDIKEMQSFASSIKDADKKSHQIISIFETYRDVIKIEDEFRLRSRRVLYQVRLQALISIIIYLLAVGFSTFEFGFTAIERWFFYSLGPFILGTFLILKRRTYKWKE